jgi:hypothetical protein
MLVGKDGMSDIIIYGPGIIDQHAEIKTSPDGRVVRLVPLEGAVLHNGRPLVEAVELRDGDRLKSLLLLLQTGNDSCLRTANCSNVHVMNIFDKPTERVVHYISAIRVELWLRSALSDVIGLGSSLVAV